MKIDFGSKRIVVSNAEMKRAQIFGSRDYEALVRVMKELPNFQITVHRVVRSHTNPCTYLTYEMMEHYIAAHAPEMMEEFMIIRERYRHYSKVKQLFLLMFPKAKDTLQFAI